MATPTTPLLEGVERVQQKDDETANVAVLAVAQTIQARHLSEAEASVLVESLPTSLAACSQAELSSVHYDLLDVFFSSGSKPTAQISSNAAVSSKDLALCMAAILSLLLQVRPPKRSKLCLTSTTSSQRIRDEASRAQAIHKLSTAFRHATIWALSAEESLEDHQDDLMVALLLLRLPLGSTDASLPATTSLIDQCLQLAALPKSSDIRKITLDPTWTTAVEHVWHRRTSVGRHPGFKGNTLFHLYRLYWFSYCLATVFIALSPAAAYWHTFNPLLEHWESRSHHPLLTLLWVVWLPTALGWSAELIRTLVLGPLPLTRLRSLPLPAGSYISLLAHAFVAGFVALRIISFGHTVPVTLAYILLAWSVPFHLFSLFVLPAGLPSLAPISNGPQLSRFKALRVLSERSHAFSPLVGFFVVSFAALFWAVNGEVDLDPSKPGIPWSPGEGGDRARSGRHTVSPIEVRSSLAAGVLFVALLGWLGGDAMTSTTTPVERADDFNEHVALEQMRFVRFFTPAQDEMPPIPAPFNLLALIPRAIGWLLSWFDNTGQPSAPSKARSLVRAVRGATQAAVWMLLWPQFFVVEQVLLLFAKR